MVRKYVPSLLSISLLFSFFQIVDMASTEILLHHGRTTGEESNAIVSDLHEDTGIWMLRCGSIFLTIAIVYFSKISRMEMYRIITSRSLDVFLGTIAGTIYFKLKISLFISVAIYSISRLIAGLSNFSGEVFGISIPIFVENLISPNETNLVFPASVVISISLSVIIFWVSWFGFKRQLVN